MPKHANSWQRQEDWAPYITTEVPEDGARLPFHESWCGQGSPLVVVARTYVWSLGVTLAHHQTTDPDHVKTYSDLLSSEKKLMSAYRSFVCDFLHQLDVHYDNVSQAQTK